MSKPAIFGGERWVEEFGFLGGELSLVYWTLLASARFRENLRRLIETLPDNCRLPKVKQIALEQFWQDMRKQHGGISGWQLSRDQIMPGLVSSCPRIGLSQYYKESLLADRVEDKWVWPESGLKIARPKVKLSTMTEEYWTELFGQRFWVCPKVVTHAEDAGIAVYFGLNAEAYLTEQLTHELLTQMPTFRISSQEMEHRTQLGIVYRIPFENLSPSLCVFDAARYGRSVHQISDVGPRDAFQAREGFATQLLRELQGLGIPIDSFETR